MTSAGGLDDTTCGKSLVQSPSRSSIDESPYELIEDDDEVLVKTAGTRPEPDEAARRTLIYEIIYSTSYRAPVLYLYFDCDSGSDKRRTSLIDILVPSVMRTQIHQVGILGAISQTVSARQPQPCSLLC